MYLRLRIYSSQAPLDARVQVESTLAQLLTVKGKPSGDEQRDWAVAWGFARCVQPDFPQRLCNISAWRF